MPALTPESAAHPDAGAGAESAKPSPPAVVLFDGVCNLCNAWVRFVIDRDPAGRFVFATLQGEVGRRLIAGRTGKDPDLGSVVLLEEGKVRTRSTAALRIARRLRGGWPLLYAFVAIPRPLRDAVYDWIARNRYRWFGRRETCAVPTAETRDRFLDSDRG